MNVHELMQKAEPHITIVNAFAKAWDVLGRFRNPVCSISGGADSDIMLDMIHALERLLGSNGRLPKKLIRERIEVLRSKL